MGEKPARAAERAALEAQRRNQSYQLLSDDDDEEDEQPVTRPDVRYLDFFFYSDYTRSIYSTGHAWLSYFTISLILTF